ncbi:MAG: ATP-binding cassette domain-containing protein [Chloroflexi bacterium]|nr:ATP-binding cassette domain-containing protein [Chloroflexota bacterium]
MQATSNFEALRTPECTGEPLIKMEQIDKMFRTPAGDFYALNHITACFYRGEFVSVVGKSGSGKSTLVNMITGIDHPTSGTVMVAGTNIHSMNESEMSIWRGRNLGVVFQFFQLLPMLTLLENVILPMDFCAMYAPEEREKRAMELLEMVELDKEADQLPAAVSGGQQQAAAIARALANDPPIIIADEPTGNLDSRTADTVFKIFARLVEQGKSIIMVTHDPSLAARTDRSMLISDGCMIDPVVAATFPNLSHRRLLWLTRQAQEKELAPGQALLNGDQAQAMYLIASGSLDVMQTTPAGQETRLERVSPGQYLSTLEMSLPPNHRVVRVSSEQPARVLALDTQAMDHWREEAPAEWQGLERAAAERTAGWTKVSE